MQSPDTPRRRSHRVLAAQANDPFQSSAICAPPNAEYPRPAAPAAGLTLESRAAPRPPPGGSEFFVAEGEGGDDGAVAASARPLRGGAGRPPRGLEVRKLTPVWSRVQPVPHTCECMFTGQGHDSCISFKVLKL